jgi:hypothetical protein
VDIRESLFSFAMLGITVVAAYFLFHDNPREKLASRGPAFIVCFLVFFYIGLANLPLALPDLFKQLLGHSVWANYIPPVRINVPQEGGTWWLVRWLNPIRTAYFYAVLGGIVWAVVNLVQRREWKWNAACLIIGAVGAMATIYLSIVCLPFCF